MNGDVVWFVAIGVFFIVSAVITALVIFKIQKRMKDKAGESPGKLPGDSGSGQYEGTGYSYRFHAGSRNTPSYFKISVRAPAAGKFKVTKESAFDRFFKRLGVCVEINTHDREFDDRFFINTETVNFCREFFSNGDRRRAIHEIFDKGFNQVVFDGHSMIATKTPCRRNKIPGQEGLDEIVSKLAILTAQMPVGVETESERVSGWKRNRIIAFAIPILLEFTGVLALIFGLIEYKPLDPWDIVLDSLKISLPLLAVFLWLAVKLVKGRSSSHRELMIIFVFAIIAFPMSGAGYEIYLNGSLDVGESSQYTVEAVNKYSKRSKDSVSYYVVVDSWREGVATERIKINHRDYNVIRPRETKLTVVTKPGKFNFEWLKGYRIVD